MTKRSLQVLVALTVSSAATYAATENVIQFQNHVRIGYDDNIYQNSTDEGSAFITEIINLSANLTFSSRTDALLYWEPEFRYRADADPDFVTYQNLYAKLNHALTERAFLTLSDRLFYRQMDGQSGGVDDSNQNYFENDLNGAVNYTLNDISFLTLGAGYSFRIWDDSDYGEWQNGEGGNDFNEFSADFSYYRQIKPNKTQVMAGIDYFNLEYDGSRGGFDSLSLIVGVDQTFNPQITAFGRVGYTMSTIDQVGGDEDTSAPYFKAGVEVNPSEKTKVSGSLGYSLSRSENSAYNAQDRFDIGVSVRRDLTAKIALTGALNYILSNYDGSYSTTYGADLPDVDDALIIFSLRCAYQLNRNNFVEAGYLFRTRDLSGGLDDNSDWDGNRVDLAWRLRL